MCLEAKRSTVGCVYATHASGRDYTWPLRALHQSVLESLPDHATRFEPLDYSHTKDGNDRTAVHFAGHGARLEVSQSLFIYTVV